MHVNFSLDDRPRFDTLSYHWSNQENSGHIALNGIEAKVIASLFDALCINQVDVEERSNQVEIIMRHIYEFARRVRIWLGTSDTDSAFIMDYIANIENRSSSGVRRLVKLASLILYYITTGLP